MSLFDAFQAVVQALPEHLPGVKVTSHFGPEYLEGHDSPPRMVWVPSDDTFDGPSKGGPNPRDILSAPTGVDIHLWGRGQPAGEGADYVATMLLRDGVLRALHASVRGVGFRVARGVNVPGDAAVTRAGWGYVLAVTIGIPVVMQPQGTATPGGISILQQGP